MSRCWGEDRSPQARVQNREGTPSREPTRAPPLSVRLRSSARHAQLPSRRTEFQVRERHSARARRGRSYRGSSRSLVVGVYGADPLVHARSIADALWLQPRFRKGLLQITDNGVCLVKREITMPDDWHAVE